MSKAVDINCYEYAGPEFSALYCTQCGGKDIVYVAQYSMVHIIFCRFCYNLSTGKPSPALKTIVERAIGGFDGRNLWIIPNHPDVSSDHTRAQNIINENHKIESIRASLDEIGPMSGTFSNMLSQMVAYLEEIKNELKKSKENPIEDLKDSIFGFRLR